MKKLFAVILTTLLLSSCNAEPDIEEVTAVSETAIPQTMSAASTAPTTVSATTAETEPPIPPKPEKPQFEHEWQSLYYDLLIETMENLEDTRWAMFNVCDLDCDGTPELLLSPYDHHPAGPGLYAVVQGELKEVGFFGSNGQFEYNFEHNYIYSFYGGFGVETTHIYKYENGNADEIIAFQTDEGYYSPPDYLKHWNINDKDVSEKEYNSQAEKYSLDKNAYDICREYALNYDEIIRVLLKEEIVPPYTYNDIKKLQEEYFLNNASFENQTEYEIDDDDYGITLNAYENGGEILKYNLCDFSFFGRDIYDYFIISDNVALIQIDDVQYVYGNIESEDFDESVATWEHYYTEFWLIDGELYILNDSNKRFVSIVKPYSVYNFDKVKELIKSF